MISLNPLTTSGNELIRVHWTVYVALTLICMVSLLLYRFTLFQSVGDWNAPAGTIINLVVSLYLMLLSGSFAFRALQAPRIRRNWYRLKREDPKAAERLAMFMH